MSELGLHFLPTIPPPPNVSNRKKNLTEKFTLNFCFINIIDGLIKLTFQMPFFLEKKITLIDFDFTLKKDSNKLMEINKKRLEEKILGILKTPTLFTDVDLNLIISKECETMLVTVFRLQGLNLVFYTTCKSSHLPRI